MANGKYKTVKRTRKAAGRTTKKVAKQTGKTIKKGAKTVARGTKQGQKAYAASAKGTSKGRTPSAKSRTKSADAAVKVRSGNKAMAAPTPKKKIKKKAYTTTPNINYQGGRTGQKKYLTSKGKQTNRKGGRS